MRRSLPQPVIAAPYPASPMAWEEPRSLRRDRPGTDRDYPAAVVAARAFGDSVVNGGLLAGRLRCNAGLTAATDRNRAPSGRGTGKSPRRRLALIGGDLLVGGGMENPVIFMLDGSGTVNTSSTPITRQGVPALLAQDSSARRAPSSTLTCSI